ncbi:MAG TPA: vitamin K epoxide reductase family protein [Candidatus Angelobacter sp.]|nr:vitamin K epoxide reductase family protein [Candidatus Angelobacter sp.]
MRWLIMLVALVGFVAAMLARHEHYRTDTSPCSINEKWDCGTVNKSPYAVFHGVLVADIGIAGYILLFVLAVKRWWPALAAASVVGLIFSLYLAHIEKDILYVWCIYCVISLSMITIITLLSLGTLAAQLLRKPRPAQ